MRICVVGPGALGCLFAARLALAGQEVWVVDHRASRAAQLARGGLVLRDRHGDCRRVAVRAVAAISAVGPAPLVLLCVKAPAVAEAARQLRPLAQAGSLIVTLQNGISHHRLVAETRPPWALGVTAQGATLEGPGRVRHGGDGPTWLGFLQAPGDEGPQRLEQTAALLCQAGMAAQVSADIRAVAWNKLIVNVGINALTALEDCANGELLTRPGPRSLMAAAVQEAALVAKACGVGVDADPLAMTEAVCQQTKDNISSMLQDIRQGRPTEIEAINGEIVRLAAAMGLAVPTNDRLLAKVRALQAACRR